MTEGESIIKLKKLIDNQSLYRNLTISLVNKMNGKIKPGLLKFPVSCLSLQQWAHVTLYLQDSLVPFLLLR
jgi:hypothetical protein